MVLILLTWRPGSRGFDRILKLYRLFSSAALFSIKMNSIICKTRLQQALGLMFHRTPAIAILQFNRPLKATIHTWFMFYAIDIYFYDSNDNLIEIKKNLKPFSHYTPEHKAKYIIEVPT